jgi:hypothetical protein
MTVTVQAEDFAEATCPSSNPYLVGGGGADLSLNPLGESQPVGNTRIVQDTEAGQGTAQAIAICAK